LRNGNIRIIAATKTSNTRYPYFAKSDYFPATDLALLVHIGLLNSFDIF